MELRYFMVYIPLVAKISRGRWIFPSWVWENAMGLMLSSSFWSKVPLESRQRPTMVDSGGFQYGGKVKRHLRKDFLYRREELYRWQVENGDYIIAGDIPIGLTKDRKFIQECLELTLDNTTLQLKMGAEGRLVNTIHGHDPDTISFWYQHVSHFPSIGWALGSSIKDSVYGFALQLLTLYELGAFSKPTHIIHCLGGSSSKLVIGMSYIIEQLGIDLDILSFDSSSATIGIKFGTLLEPDGPIAIQEVRSGRRTFTLWNGQILKDIPRKIGGQLMEDIIHTFAQNFMLWWNKHIAQVVQQRGEEYEQLVEESGARFVYGLWKSLGVRGLYSEYVRRGFFGRVLAKEDVDSCQLL